MGILQNSLSQLNQTYIYKKPRIPKILMRAQHLLIVLNFLLHYFIIYNKFKYICRLYFYNVWRLLYFRKNMCKILICKMIMR